MYRPPTYEEPVLSAVTKDVLFPALHNLNDYKDEKGPWNVCRLELHIKWREPWLTWTSWERVDTLLVQLLALAQIVWWEAFDLLLDTKHHCPEYREAGDHVWWQVLLDTFVFGLEISVKLPGEWYLFSLERPCRMTWDDRNRSSSDWRATWDDNIYKTVSMMDRKQEIPLAEVLVFTVLEGAHYKVCYRQQVVWKQWENTSKGKRMSHYV